jgi:hypothetical protein
LRSSSVKVTVYFFILNPPEKKLIMKEIYHILYDITSVT